MPDFVSRRSIVRSIWGASDPVLLIFAGSAAEFALNRAVDWLFFTGQIPQDPIGRLFSTVRYAQEIVFVDETAARRTLDRICSIHKSVEGARGAQIPDWAFRDVLYMLIDYSERAHSLLYRPLTKAEKRELYDVFRRVGEGLRIPGLPANYAEWQDDRRLHLERDLVYSEHTRLLFEKYREHLGAWRYEILRLTQAQLAPERVRRLLGLSRTPLLFEAFRAYGLFTRLNLQELVHWLLLPSQYVDEVRKFDRSSAIPSGA
ncbi:MAG TPA: oxygenase MpaB family protein [Blastocatellia bacterium]|nr:oxygenase MpaB family protein [Blastocatellia bacterium]